MRLILSLFCLSLCVSALNAQELELGLGGGVGSFYIFENRDDDVNNSFTSAGSLYTDIKYNFADRKNGLKLRLQMTSTQISGEDYQTRNFTNGYIEALTTSLLYERLDTDKELALGYFFGAGYTVQTFDRLASSLYTLPDNRYMSISGGAILHYAFNSGLGIRMEPSIQWTDPINSLRQSTEWQTAGEDLNFILQIGLTYRIPLNKQVIEEVEIIEVIEEE